MKINTALCWIALPLLIVGPWTAVRADNTPHDYGISIGPTVGTLGYGLDFEQKLTDSFGYQLVGDTFHYNYTGSIKGVPYKLKLGLGTLGLLGDYYPFQGGFRLVGGVRLNGNELKESAAGQITINGNTYSTGQLSGKVTYENKVSPYLGVGYVGHITDNFEINTDLGALYQGSAHVVLSSPNGTISAADLATQVADVKKYAQDLQFYPVLSLTLAYHF